MQSGRSGARSARILNQQLMELSPAERREARQQMKLYQELGLEKLPLDKDISFDGTVLDSRAEIILYEFLKNSRHCDRTQPTD